MEIENLINNLNRAADDWEEKHPVTYTGNLRVQDALRDAASALSTLQAENERLRGELEYDQEHANAYHEECEQWEIENEKLRAELEQVKQESDAAVSDMETIMAYGGGNLNTCQYCKNGQCYVRGGTKLCLPKWRGQKED